MQLATAYVLAASNNDERLVDTRTVDFCKTKVIVSFKENREFNKRRFWATHVNRKWAFFSFNIPWRYQICIAKCLYSCRDDLPKNWFKVQKVHFRLTCVAQKRRCFNSLINELDRAQSYLAKFITDLPPEIPHDICFYPIDHKARAGIVSKVY